MKTIFTAIVGTLVGFVIAFILTAGALLLLDQGYTALENILGRLKKGIEACYQWLSVDSSQAPQASSPTS